MKQSNSFNSIEKEINKSSDACNVNSNENVVAIVGIGFRLPIGESGEKSTPKTLWNNLMNGFDGVRKTSERFSDNYFKNHEISSNYGGLLPLDEIKSFDPLFFGINPNEAPTIDPSQRLLLKCTWEALEDSMVDPLAIKGSNTSVFIGCSTVDYHTMNKNEVKSNVFGSTNHSISNRISYCYDLHGTSLTVDTACSSSMNAVFLGYESIKNNKSKMSIVGGANLLLDPYFFTGFSSMNMLSKSNGRCNAFDASADGFVRGECIGVVVLKNLQDAIKDGNRIYCTINGASSNVDGIGFSDKLNFYSPSSISQTENMKKALLSTNGTVKSSDIDYVEAHGTGTPTGDPIETKGISNALNTINDRSPLNPLLIGSFKSNVGHSEAASGVASLIKCCLMYKNRCFAPNIHFKIPNPAIKFKEWNLKVVTQPIPFNENKSISMVVNNFGATGSNCCLVLSQFNNNSNQQQIQSTLSPTTVDKFLIPFSANSVESLKKYQSLVIDNNELESNYKFDEFVKNQIFNKSISLCQRSVIIAKDWDEFNNIENQIKYQTSSSASSNITITNKNSNPITVFVFCGQASQYPSMGKNLYENEPVFKQSMDKLNEKFTFYYGYSILDRLRQIDDKDIESLNDQNIAQPSTCMIQISLFELYKHWGIEPSFIIGHSLGEITASYCSGMINLDTFCYLIYNRSTIQSKTNGSGKMLSINISADEYNLTFSSRYPTVEIACYNSPSSIVIAGNEQLLNEISTKLKEKEIFSAMLGSLSAFHTSKQLMIKDDILSLNIQPQQPSIPTFSTVTSNLFDESTIFNSEYFFNNIVKPVSFTQTISNLYQHIETNKMGSEIVFIEIAPHPTLQYYLKQMIPNQSEYFKNGESISIYSPLHKKKNDTKEFQETISKLFCENNYNVNFKCQFNNIDVGDGDKNINLPLYQWDDQQFWLSKSITHKNNSNGPPISILGHSMNDCNPLVKSYQTFIDPAKGAFEYFKGHNVSGKCYFPGAGYIDNILKMYPNQDLTIGYMEFKTPLILEDGIDQCLQTNVYQIGKSEYRAQFHFKDEKTNVWIQTAVGNLQLFSQGHGKADKMNVAEIKSKKCNITKIPWDRLYPHIKNKTGLNYQKKFQNTLECYIGDGCSLTEISLELPSENFHDQNSFFTAPILDMIFHGPISLIKEQTKIVLDRVEGFKYYKSNIPINRDDHSSIFVYSAKKGRIGNSYISSVVVMLEDGTKLIEIDSSVCTSLTPTKDELLIEIQSDLIYTPYLQPKDSEIRSPSEYKSIYQIHKNYPANYNNNSIISDIVLQTIKPLIYKKMEFRIIEFGAGINSSSLSIMVLGAINSLFEKNPHFEIDIEYTWSDISSSAIQDTKDKLSINKGINIIYSSLDLEDKQQKLNPSYYDLVIVSNVSTLTSDIKYGIDKIYQILNPNGHLLLNQQKQQQDENKSEILTEISTLRNLLKCNFKSDIQISNDVDSLTFVIQAQKPSLQLQKKPIYSFDNVILFCNDSQESIISKFENHYNDIKNIIKISTFEQFNELSSTITDNSIIYFIKTIEQLTLDNFKLVTFEYIQINQKLYELKSKCKHVLITCDSQTNNYLSSSVLGAARYFDECPTLQLFTLDYDIDSINKLNISTIDYLTNPNQNTHIEFFVRNNIYHFERMFRETKNLSKTFKSESYHDLSTLNENQETTMIHRLDENLEYQLKSRATNLKQHEIEVQVAATGINYKDYLTYIGIVKPTGDHIEIGIDFSGVVTRVGSKSSNEFKVGDQVYGVGCGTSSSHIIIDSLFACHKPTTINHIQAASIPVIYATSLHSLYNIGNLRDGESVLIHSGSGGVGLSALEILRWKNHNGPIFVTVGSDDKKQYLIDTYGDLITDIYSTRDMNYQKQIKNKLSKLGYDNLNNGVDLIVNTLSSDYMDSNFKCLNPEGRIVDLSVTHLTPHEFIDNNKYKYNVGYHNVEIFNVEKPTIKKLLSKISKAIQSGELNGIIPITEFSNSNFKQAIEYINERKHVGKIVVNNDINMAKKLISSHITKGELNFSILKSDYKINNLGKNILVTGQTGLIIQILEWIVKYSSTVENIIILSKSSLKWELEFLIELNKQRNNSVKFHFKMCDISNSESVDNTFDKLLSDNPLITNIDSIFHFAVAQISRKMKDIDMKMLNISHGAKTMGAINLHNQSIKRDWKLVNFMLASSALSILGSYDQCGYVSACCVLNSLSSYRRSIGLPCISTNIGGVSGSGMVARSDLIETLLSGQGYDLINTNQLLGALDLQIQNPDISNNIMVGVFNFPIFKSLKQKIHQKFDFILNSTKSINQNCENNGTSTLNIKEKFLKKVSELLSIDQSKINNDIKLINYGADSLLTVQLKNWVDKEWASNLITIQQIQSNPIGIVYQTIIDNFEKRKK